MGYWTEYNLETDQPEDIQAQIIEEFRNEFPRVAKAIQSDGTSEDITNMDEPQYEKYILPFSKKYPEVLFTTHGIGSAPDDFWVLYVKNGKCQFALGEITYADYDPEKLT